MGRNVAAFGGVSYYTCVAWRLNSNAVLNGVMSQPFGDPVGQPCPTTEIRRFPNRVTGTNHLAESDTGLCALSSAGKLCRIRRNSPANMRR
jgi:hypothetical protein